jgi:hypothetical protein
MINHLYLRRALVLPVLGLAGSVAHAQTTTATQTDAKKAPSTTTSTKPGAPAAAPVVPKASGQSALPASDKIPPTPPTGSAPASDAAQKKHIAGVKYEDRTASNLDAGSKDAAKVPTLDAGSKDAAK